MSRQNRATSPPKQGVAPFSRPPCRTFLSFAAGRGGGGLVEGIAALLGSENGSRYRGVSQLQPHQSRYSVQLRTARQSQGKDAFWTDSPHFMHVHPSPQAAPSLSPLGACAVTTKFLDNKICTFKILLSWRFPRKNSVLDDFTLCPKSPPSKSEAFIFIVVSPPLNHWSPMQTYYCPRRNYY